MGEGRDPEVLMRELSHDADFDEEVKLTYGKYRLSPYSLELTAMLIKVKKTYGKYGVEGLLDKIDAWKNQPIKIAVVNNHLLNIH